MKTVLITGGGSGLGESLAMAYSNKGYQVILTGRTESKLKTVADKIISDGGRAFYYSCDVANRVSIDSLKDKIDKDFGKINLLINCAGVGYFGPLETLSEYEIETMFRINTLGTIYMTQTFIKSIEKRIINIISTAGLKGKVNESVYVASKFAVRGFTESLQKEMADTGLNIMGVYMGGIATPFWNESDHIKDKSRLKSPDKIADLIVSADESLKELII